MAYVPRIFRSSEGCCICTTKSSSSRFANTEPYKPYFPACFHLEEPQTDKICNACVLVVKRFKKLPPGSTRHWANVVGSRGGKGAKKSIRTGGKGAKKSIRTVKKKTELDEHGPITTKYKHSYRKTKKSSNSPPTRSNSQSGTKVARKNPRKGVPQKCLLPKQDLDYWKQEKKCCGTVFVGKEGELLIDPSLLHPCGNRKKERSNCDSQSICNKSTVISVNAASPDEAMEDVVDLTNANADEAMEDVDDLNGTTADNEVHVINNELTHNGIQKLDIVA